MLDIIGTIYDADLTDPENPVSTPKAGWHVNSLTQLEGLDDYLVTPATPRRIFQTPADTFFYVFADENEANNVLNSFPT